MLTFDFSVSIYLCYQHGWMNHHHQISLQKSIKGDLKNSPPWVCLCPPFLQLLATRKLLGILLRQVMWPLFLIPFQIWPKLLVDMFSFHHTPLWLFLSLPRCGPTKHRGLAFSKFLVPNWTQGGSTESVELTWHVLQPPFGNFCALLGEQPSGALSMTAHTYWCRFFLGFYSLSVALFLLTFGKGHLVYFKRAATIARRYKKMSQLHTSTHHCTWAEAGSVCRSAHNLITLLFAFTFQGLSLLVAMTTFPVHSGDFDLGCTGQDTKMLS